MLPDFVFRGYCAKQALTADPRPLASVSECLSKRPPQWIARWDFNRATCWNSEAAAPHYQSMGNAAVDVETFGFGCSPLSCNHMAESIPVNGFCLLGDLETALATARTFGIQGPEPGPYVIIEVLSASSVAQQHLL